MARKVYVRLEVRIIIDMDEGIEVSEVINELDYNFKSETDGAEITDTQISDHTVIDST